MEISLKGNKLFHSKCYRKITEKSTPVVHIEVHQRTEICLAIQNIGAKESSSRDYERQFDIDILNQNQTVVERN